MFFLNLYLSISFILQVFFTTSTTSHRDCLSLVQIEEINSTTLKCAGTVLTNNTILTSAHCLQNKTESSVTVRQISSPRTNRSHQIDRIILHPAFNNSTLENDIAILKIKGTLIRPWAKIRLSNSSIIDPLNYYQDCNVISWFARDHQILKAKLTQVHLVLIPKDNCVKRFEDSRGSIKGKEKICGYYNHNMGDCFFGTGGPVLCKSRSYRDIKPVKWLNNDDLAIGAKEVEKSKFVGKNDTLDKPLDLLINITKRKRSIDRVQHIQVGIVSWEHGCSTLPSILTRVDFYHKWIKETVEELCKCQDEILVDVYTPNRKPIISNPSHSCKSQHVSTCLILFNVFLILLIRASLNIFQSV